MEYVHKDVHLAQFEWYGARCKTVRLLQLADWAITANSLESIHKTY